MLATEALFAIISMLSIFGCIFGIFYLRSRVNMAMIEKGFNPKQDNAQPKPFTNLKFGLLFLGAGLGLIAGYLTDTVALNHKLITEHYTTDSTGKIVQGYNSNNKIHQSSTYYGQTIEVSGGTANGLETHTRITDQREPLIYFAFIAIGGGLGLILSYRIEKKQWLDKKASYPQP